MLLGAGFSRNWGGWLASARFATIWLGVSRSAPIAAMAAVIAPAVFSSAEHVWSVRASEKVVGLLIAFAVHRRTSSTWMTISSGILALELMKMVY
ncbi:AzlD domain-containing protein [Trinickia sp.]|uniref:AzlD domain-containing protein n=1 Tax=Trinickia sp. TaxID=2571163 RepID=UPI002F41E813